MPSMSGEVALRKWMMDRDTLGCSGQRGSQDLGELVSGDYLALATLLWCREVRRPHIIIPNWLRDYTFWVGAWGSVYNVSICYVVVCM